MRVAYADPPYPGQAAKHYADHPDYAGEVNHVELLRRLEDEYDGWVLHTSSVALGTILEITDIEHITGFRVMAWVKPFAAFKRNVSVAYAWEPVLVKPCRKPVVSGRVVMRDWIAESITLKRGLSGAKPEAVCRWAFEMLGLKLTDTLDDLFPGTGAVTRAGRGAAHEGPGGRGAEPIRRPVPRAGEGGMKAKVVQTEHTLPNPMRTEGEIVAAALLFRLEMEARGGRVVKEYRKRNIAFDRPGEKTTTVFVVDWP